MVAPYISREDVGAALASLIHATRPANASGLQHLLLVDLLVDAPDMPTSDEARTYAVRELLVSEIARALNEQRRVFGLMPISELAPRDEALAALSEHVRMGARELLEWSVLYYRYVRSDLALSVETLAALIAVQARTITRYHDDAIKMLTERLIRAEQMARREQLDRRLLAALPYSVPVRLVGRDDLLRMTEDALRTLSPRHILITGTTGVGKTTFVQELLRRQISAGYLDQLVWLEQPGSAQLARQQIAEMLLREDSRLTLRDYLLLYRVAVVLDEIDMAASDRDAFAALLRDLGAALVCLINRVYVPLVGVEAHLPLGEIGRDDADVVVDDVLRLYPTLRAEDRREAGGVLYEHLGGNPLALKLAAGLWVDSDDWRLLEAEVHEHLFGKLFAALDVGARQAWCAFALLPRAAHHDDLAGLWGLSAEAVGGLLRLSLLERGEDDAYQLVGGARAFIRAQYAISDAVRGLFDGLIDAVRDGDRRVRRAGTDAADALPGAGRGAACSVDRFAVGGRAAARSLGSLAGDS